MLYIFLITFKFSSAIHCSLLQVMYEEMLKSDKTKTQISKIFLQQPSVAIESKLGYNTPIKFISIPSLNAQTSNR